MKDAVGNEIHEGAILRWYHFTGSSGKKYYMYKQAGTIDGSRLIVYHLPKDGSCFLVNEKQLKDCVVVACRCEYHIEHDLKRSRTLRD